MGKHKIGDRLDDPGRVTFVDGNAHDGPPRGFYRMKRDGKSYDDSLRLRWVDDAPDNSEDWSGHFEVMAPEAGFGYFHGKGSSQEPVAEGSIAPLAAEIQGEANVAAAPAPSPRVRFIFRRRQ